MALTASSKGANQSVPQVAETQHREACNPFEETSPESRDLVSTVSLAEKNSKAK